MRMMQFIGIILMSGGILMLTGYLTVGVPYLSLMGTESSTASMLKIFGLMYVIFGFLVFRIVPEQKFK